MECTTRAVLIQCGLLINLLLFTPLVRGSGNMTQQSLDAYTIPSDSELAARNQSVTLAPVTEIPLYKFVTYVTDQTQQKDPKVFELHMKYFYFYTHIYLASSLLMKKELSLVALQDSELVGANMLFSVDQLHQMYAPKKIAAVLNFVLKCYAAARPLTFDANQSESLISTLRVASSNKLNQALIRATTSMFLNKTSHGSYHLLWENKMKTDTMLRKLGYERLFCGNETDQNPCDWTQMNVPLAEAKDVCLYRLLNNQ